MLTRSFWREKHTETSPCRAAPRFACILLLVHGQSSPIIGVNALALRSCPFLNLAGCGANGTLTLKPRRSALHSMPPGAWARGLQQSVTSRGNPKWVSFAEETGSWSMPKTSSSTPKPSVPACRTHRGEHSHPCRRFAERAHEAILHVPGGGAAVLCDSWT